MHSGGMVDVLKSTFESNFAKYGGADSVGITNLGGTVRCDATGCLPVCTACRDDNALPPPTSQPTAIRAFTIIPTISMSASRSNGRDVSAPVVVVAVLSFLALFAILVVVVMRRRGRCGRSCVIAARAATSERLLAHAETVELSSAGLQSDACYVPITSGASREEERGSAPPAELSALASATSALAVGGTGGGTAATTARAAAMPPPPPPTDHIRSARRKRAAARRETQGAERDSPCEITRGTADGTAAILASVGIFRANGSTSVLTTAEPEGGAPFAIQPPPVLRRGVEMLYTGL